jgi:hypothetical protein
MLERYSPTHGSELNLADEVLSFIEKQGADVTPDAISLHATVMHLLGCLGRTHMLPFDEVSLGGAQSFHRLSSSLALSSLLMISTS